MIYTYGYSPAYDESMEEHRIAGTKMQKLGKRDYLETINGPYAGGAIWMTPEEGYEYIDSLGEPELGTKEDWFVYALYGTQYDVYKIEGEPFHRLKIDRPVLWKVPRS